MEFVSLYAYNRAKFTKNGLLRAIGTFFILFFVVTAFSVVCPPDAGAGQATLTWSAATSTGVKGYKVYYGTASGTYSKSVDAGNTTSCSVSNLTDGQTYYFVATTYDSAGDQSIYSNEVSKTIAQSTFTITASAGTGGNISPSGSATVTSGGSLAYSITPASGYQVSNVTVDGSSVGAVSSYSFSNVTANHTISATFTASTSSSGVGTSSTGSITSSSVWQNQSFASQTGVFTASFDMIPNSNDIDAVTVLSSIPAQSFSDGAAIVRFNTSGNIDARNGSSYAADVVIPYSAGSTYHVRIAVNVPKKTYDVYVTPSGGTEVHLASGYAFRTEQNSVSSLNNLGVFADIGNHQVLNFAIASVATYSISASAGTGGNISPSGSVTVNSGGSQAYSITPASGYQISNVTVDGSSVGAVSSYSFSNVTANHTIAATFKANPVSTFTITASAGTGGSISPSGSASVNSGGSQAYTITPSSGYQISDITVDGSSVGAVSSYSFSNVTANHTISATFTASTSSSGTGTSSSTSAASGTTTFAINCAGPSYTASNSLTFKSDTDYNGGGSYNTRHSIAGTSNGELYQTYRAGYNFSYNIPLPDGNYYLSLLFAEDQYNKKGQRVFDVTVQGITVLNNLDVYAEAGSLTAYNVDIPVTVTNGVLNISFSGKVSKAEVNAISIIPR